MRERDLIVSEEEDQVELTANRPISSAPKHSSRAQFSYARGRKKPPTHFNGMHRRRTNKWSW